MKNFNCLNKTEFIATMASIHGLKKVDASLVTETFLSTLYYIISNGENIKFLGDFGIEIKPVPERKFKNMSKPGEFVVVEAHNKVVCKIGNRLQYLANGGTLEDIYGEPLEEPTDE